MRAIDTNVVVRFLTADDPHQAEAARGVIAAGDVFVSLTVCLETAWVLRGGYGFDADQVAGGLAGVAGLPGITVEDPMRLATAIEWMRGGMDFADALHLAKAGGCSAFLTFDRKLAKAAEGRSAVPVETP